MLNSVIVYGHFSSKVRKQKRLKKKKGTKNQNRWQRKHQSPFIVFPSIPQAPRMCPVGTEPGSNLLELRPAAGGAGFGVPLPVVPEASVAVTSRVAGSCQSSL